MESEDMERENEEARQRRSEGLPITEKQKDFLHSLILERVDGKEERERWFLEAEAVEFVKTCKSVTSEKLMKKFSIGYAKSAHLVDILVGAGLIEKDESNKDERTYEVIK